MYSRTYYPQEEQSPERRQSPSFSVCQPSSGNPLCSDESERQTQARITIFLSFCQLRIVGPRICGSPKSPDFHRAHADKQEATGPIFAPGPVFSDCLPNQPATSYFSSCCKDIECRRLNDPPERPLEMVRGITFAYVDFQHGFGNTRREGESRNN